MFICSALYNMAQEGRRKTLFRRLDHAAIFLLIAGTYTPFTLIVIGGRLGAGLLVFVWLVAAAGMVFKLLSPTRWQPLAIATYLEPVREVLIGFHVFASFLGNRCQRSGK